KSQGEVGLAGGPCGSVHQGRGIATAGGIDGRQADSLVELPVAHEPRVEGRAIGDRHTDGGGGAEVTGDVAGDGGQGVGAVDRGRRIPGGRVGRRGDLGAEVDAIEFELDPDDAHVVGGARRDREGAGDGGSGGRGHDGGRRRRDVSERGGDGGRGAQGHGAGAGAGAAAAAPAAEGRARGRRGRERYGGTAGEARRAGRAAGDAGGATRHAPGAGACFRDGQREDLQGEGRGDGGRGAQGHGAGAGARAAAAAPAAEGRAGGGRGGERHGGAAREARRAGRAAVDAGGRAGDGAAAGTRRVDREGEGLKGKGGRDSSRGAEGHGARAYAGAATAAP